MQNAASLSVADQSLCPTQLSWSDGSPEKGIRLDPAARKLCEAVCSHIQTTRNLIAEHAMRMVLLSAHTFNDQASRTARTPRGLWKYLDDLVRPGQNLSVDMSCGGVPYIVECFECEHAEIAFYNTRNGRGQFSVSIDGELEGYCRKCLVSRAVKATSHKIAEANALIVRSNNRKKPNSLEHSHVRGDASYTTPAHRKRGMKFDRRAQGHGR